MPTNAAAPIQHGTRDKVPVGSVVFYVGENAPLGWLMCYGQTLNKVDYPKLAAKCGTKYGAGSSTTFVLPDIRGRVIAGQDDMGGTSANRLVNSFNGDNIGATGGGEEGIAATTGSDLAQTGAGTYVQSVSGYSVQPTLILNAIIKHD